MVAGMKNSMETMGIAGAVLRIDLGAIASNYRLLAAQVAPATIAGVVKADGYGLGAVAVARTLIAAGCRDLFVALLPEAVALKPHLPADASLYVLNGLTPGAESVCAKLGAIPVLNSLDQVDRWAATARRLGRVLPAALQVDSGMARLGLPPEDAIALADDPARLCGIAPVLVMSHLACGDEPDSDFNDTQRRAFLSLAGRFPGVRRSLDNSGGSFLPRGHLDLVRAGIAVYGGAPQPGPNPMRAVVSLTAGIVQVRTVAAGAGVGYGLSHHVARESRIATIPVGYADGWPRHLSNTGSAFIGGHRVPIAGRVSMDSILLDVTDVPPDLLAPGAPVELLGPHQTIDDVARDAGTISYEILTRLGHRYERIYEGEQA